MQNHLEVILASKIRRLQNLYNRISVESGYREQVGDNTYTVKMQENLQKKIETLKMQEKG